MQTPFVIFLDIFFLSSCLTISFLNIDFQSSCFFLFFFLAYIKILLSTEVNFFSLTYLFLIVWIFDMKLDDFLSIFTNPSAWAGYDTRSIFNQCFNRFEFFIIQGFQSTVFTFIVIFTTFQSICPPAFFRCLSNLGANTELQTTSFI